MIFFTRLPKRRQRRKRCIVCKQLTYSSWWLAYSWDGETLTEGIHCDPCRVKTEKELERMRIG